MCVFFAPLRFEKLGSNGGGLPCGITLTTDLQQRLHVTLFIQIASVKVLVRDYANEITVSTFNMVDGLVKFFARPIGGYSESVVSSR